MTFHSGIGLFAARLGQPWMLVGAAFNALIMVSVTFLTESRMVARAERAKAYRQYQQTTSVWVPWFNSKPKSA